MTLRAHSKRVFAVPNYCESAYFPQRLQRPWGGQSATRNSYSTELAYLRRQSLTHWPAISHRWLLRYTLVQPASWIALKHVGRDAEKVLLMGERDSREAGCRTPIHCLSSSKAVVFQYGDTDCEACGYDACGGIYWTPYYAGSELPSRRGREAPLPTRTSTPHPSIIPVANIFTLCASR